MSLPNFLLIGSGKGGTTSIYAHLDEHPQVFMSPIKEPNFFAWDPVEPGVLAWGSRPPRQFPVTDLAAYEALFEGGEGAVALGEASVVYLESRDAPARIREALPRVRLLASLRNPIDRAYSGYWMGARLGTHDLDPREAIRPDGDLVQAGFYHRLLTRYLERFERAQLHVVLFDDLLADPLKTMRGIYRFLGVDDRFTPDVGRRRNPGGAPRSRLIQKLVHARTVRTLLSPLARGPLRRGLVGLKNRNIRPAPPMPQDLRRELAGLYREEVDRLGRFLDRDLSDWVA